MLSNLTSHISGFLPQAVQHRNRVILLLLVLALGLFVRALTANFIQAHFNDSAWFQFGSYAVFDRQAQAVLDGKESFFWINDSSRTDLIQYPPGYRLWVAVLYGICHTRTPSVVQRVQLVLDAFSVLVLVGIGATAFGWTTGIVAGFLMALSPLFALAGATPNADAPTSWFVLAGVLMLVMSFKHASVIWAIGAGFMIGVACWLRVNPFFLVLVWGLVLTLLGRAPRRKRICVGLATVLGAALTISPVVVRNLVVFYPEVVTNGLSIGVNLWEGIGDTSRGREFGAPASDAEMIAQDRHEMGLPADAPLQLFWPDGIRRDRMRTQKSLAVIRSHPFWFAGIMMKRIWGHLKFAGSPAPHVGSMGINVTSQKCLPPARQHGPLAILVTALGMIQSVLRYLQLPLILIGIAVAWRTNWRITALLLTTILYYLLTMSVGHSEIRYGLPMQALLLLFASVAIRRLSTALRNQFSPQPSSRAQAMS